MDRARCTVPRTLQESKGGDRADGNEMGAGNDPWRRPRRRRPCEHPERERSPRYQPDASQTARASRDASAPAALRQSLSGEER